MLKQLLNLARRLELKKRTPKPKQFDFSRNWKSKIVPHLNDPDVESALTYGLTHYDKDYRPGDPPWLCGRGGWNGQRATEGSLSWYQPWGRCHHIAPFCWALGQKIYPDLNWGFVSGDKHSVVVGWSEDWEQPERVLDILTFEEWSAQQSLDFARQQNGKFHDSLSRYAATFSGDPEETYEAIETAKIIGVDKVFGPDNKRCAQLIGLLMQAERISESVE